ncbi:MAG: rhomboid family intramembrane serine protease [Deltaproteobacteria bacterium]|nr:rhomboid family intramembrane serine protease [Deltaproteobacteria bacterium]
MVALYVLVALNVVAALAIAWFKRDVRQLLQVDPQLLVRWGGMYTPFVRRGQYWRIASSIFLHANLQHLLANSAALFVAGAIAGERLGELMLVATYLATGVAGSTVSYLARRNRVVRYDESVWRMLLVPNPLAVAVGASGAICGLIAAAGIDAHLHGDHETRDALVKWLAIILGYSLVPGIDKAGHVGGALAGVVIGVAGGQPGLEAPAIALVAVVVVVVLFRIAQLHGAEGETVDRWTKRAVDAREAKDTGTEIAAYRQSLELHPRNAVASYNLSLALERSADLAGALAQAEHTVTLMSGETDAVRLRDRLARAIAERDGPTR